MKKVTKENIYLTDYNSAKEFCFEYRAPFKKFTKLQEYILLKRQFWDLQQNLIIKGVPGSGKTLLVEMAYLAIPLKKNKMKRKLLYLVPYKALLNEKYSYFINRFDRYSYDIYRSSSDYSDNDENIISSNCEIAIMIYEKLDNALQYNSENIQIFYNYDLVVMDEFSLISSMERGIVVNSILEQYYELPEYLLDKRKARVIALTVPECGTSEYSQYDFLTLTNAVRPVIIHEAIIQVDRGIVVPKEVDIDWPVSYEKINTTPIMKQLGDDIYLKNDIDIEVELAYQENKELLPSLIKAHRKLNHHIIIFCSSRENVRNLSYSISRIISTNKLLHGDWSKRLISIQQNMGDNAYGCIDERMIHSAQYGVVYHNADLPLELRKEIEKEFSKKESRIDVIVSTETLAYGINCSADVVIIYEKIKPTIAEDFPNFKFGSGVYMRYLNSVEYQNFIGRAGRLGYEKEGKQHYGYAYMFSRDYKGTKKIRSSYYSDYGRRFRSCRRLFALKLWHQPETTTTIIFNQIKISKMNGFIYDDIIDAVRILTGKKKIAREETIISVLIVEMKKLHLIEEDNGNFFLTRMGESLHGIRVSYSVLVGLENIIENIKYNGCSMFFLLFQICKLVRNADLCYINRKISYLQQLGKDITAFFDLLEEQGDINKRNLKSLRSFEKNVRNMIDELDANENGYAYISEELSDKLHQYQNAAMLYLWAEGYSIERINKEYRLLARFGAIYNLAKNIIYVLDILQKCMEVYIGCEEDVKKVRQVKFMIKYGMPYYCIELLNFQIEMSIRPEICRMIELKDIDECTEILKKISISNNLNDSVSLIEAKRVRKYLIEQLERGR